MTREIAREQLVRVHAPRPFISGFVDDARDVFRQKELISHLTRKQLKIMYTGSVLGFFWSIVMPLVQLAVYWLVVGKFLGADSIPAFGLFMYSGLVVIAILSDILTRSTASVVANASLVKKVYLPREIFPITATFTAVVNFGFLLLVLVLGTILAGFTTGIWPNLQNVWLPLLGFVVLVVFGLALGMLLAAANVFFRDFEHLVRIATMLLMWLTPVLYSAHQVTSVLPGPLAQLFLVNPATPVVYSFRAFFWPQGFGTEHAELDHLVLRLVITLVASLCLLFLAHRVFSRVQSRFAQAL